MAATSPCDTPGAEESPEDFVVRTAAARSVINSSIPSFGCRRQPGVHFPGAQGPIKNKCEVIFEPAPTAGHARQPELRGSGFWWGAQRDHDPVSQPPHPV